MSTARSSPAESGRSTLYRDAALADGRSDRLQVGVSLLVQDGRIRWTRPAGEEGECPPGCELVDAGGTTIVPGLVDGHSHLTLPGGSPWIERGTDPTETLVAVAEANGELEYHSGVRWARDVGSPRRAYDRGERAVALGVRDRWRGRRDRPYGRGRYLDNGGRHAAGRAVGAGPRRG
jgi:imidazolonepropionase-like amidohydrolase